MALNNNKKDQVGQSLKELYQNQNKIPPFIEDMEGMKEYDMKEYYVRLKTILKEKEDANQSNYEEVAGEKINIEVNDVFDQIKDQAPPSKVLILGGAGVGKSTLMQYMAFKWSNDEIWKKKFDVIYRVTLKTLLNGSWKTKYLENSKYASEIDKEPLRYIIHYNIIRIASENFSASQLLPEDLDFTNSNKILFLLDGYDEVAHMDDPFYQKLEQQIFQQKNLILTSRPNAIIPQFKSRFERIIENIGLDNDGIDLYTKLYFKGNTPQIIKKYEAIDSFLSSNASLKNICNLPVNIAMLCYIFQGQEEGTNLEILNSSQLYYLVVQKLGERFLSKEYKGSSFESQSLKDKIEEKLRNLPELKALKHIAYSGMTGGGIQIDDSSRKESLIIKGYKDTKDEFQASIQKSIETLNLKTNINKIVKYGLLKQEGENQKNKDYSFIHLSFQEYLTAQYLTDILLLGSEKEKFDVITYISTHRNEPRLLMTLKFMAGIISTQNNIEILDDFWNSVVCNVEGILEFSLGQKIKLLMNLLGQSKSTNEELDQRIPNLREIINLIDVVVISNLLPFKDTLKDSDYLSSRMHLLILKYVEESKDESSSILQEMVKPNSFEPIQQLINYIVGSQKEQDHLQISETLKLSGLELILQFPHKFKQELISTTIMSVLKNQDTTWQNKQTALSIFNLITPKLKGSQILNDLKSSIFEFLISHNSIELYDTSLESLKYSSNFNEKVFGLLKQMIIYNTLNSLYTVENIAEFIKYIQTHSPQNLQIQKLITSFVIDIPTYFEDQKDYIKIKVCQFMPKMLSFIDAIEKSQMAQKLIKILLQIIIKKKEEDDKNFLNDSISSIPEIFEFIEEDEKLLLFKEVSLHLEKMLNDEAQQTIFKIISLLSSKEKQVLFKQQIHFLKDMISDEKSPSQFNDLSFPQITNFLEREEKFIFTKEIVNTLLNLPESSPYLRYLIHSAIISLVKGLHTVDSQLLCKDVLKFIINEDFQISSGLSELAIMIELVNVEERQIIGKEVFQFLLKLIERKSKNDFGNNDIFDRAINSILKMIDFIDQAQKQLHIKDLFKYFEKLLENDIGEVNSFTVIRNLQQLLKNINDAERTLFAKSLIKSLEKVVDDENNNFIVRSQALKYIPKAFKYVDLIERYQMSEDLLQYFENLLGMSDNKIHLMISIFQTFGLIYLEKRILLAKNVIKSLDLLIEEKNSTDFEIYFPNFFSYFIKFIEQLDEAERLFFAQEAIKFLKKFIIKEMHILTLFLLKEIPKVIELVKKTDRLNIAKQIIKIIKCCFESTHTDIRQQACASISKVICSLYTKEDIKQILKENEYVDVQLLARDAIKSFQNLLEEQENEVQFNALISIQEIFEILDSNERSSLALQMIKSLEKEKKNKDILEREKAYEFERKMLVNLNITERTLIEDEVLQSIVSLLENKYDFTIAIKMLLRIFDFDFDQNNKFSISKKILDIMFFNKTKSVTDLVQFYYLKELVFLKSQLQFIQKIESFENDMNSIPLSKFHQDSFYSEVWKFLDSSIDNLEFQQILHKMKSRPSKFKTLVPKMKSLFFNELNVNFCNRFGLPSHKMIHILLWIIGNENEDISSRKELVKEAKSMIGLILKYLDQTGIDWIQTNLSKLINLSNYSQKIVSKVCSILLEDGIISDNERAGGINEFKILANIIKSSGNISLNDRGTITVDGKRYTLLLDDNGRISLDREVSELLKNHTNPFIRQYFEYKPVFVNNSQGQVANLDRRQYSIADNEWSNKKWDSSIDQNWKLVELEKYNGGKIVFFEKKDIFGKRMVLKIKEYADNNNQLIKIFDSNREKIFGKYNGHMMFYAQLSKQDSWRNNVTDEDFINGYKNKDTLDGKSISDKQVLFHDGLLCMGVTSDRMQDIVFFEFMKTIKDQEEELKHEIRKMNLENHEKELLEYYGAFLKTFSLCYTEAQVIASGKFSFDVSNKGVTVLSKLASIIPMIGDIASSVISSIGEFIVSIGIERKANSFLQFAHDHSNLSKKAGILAKQIILKKGFELVKNNSEMGYVSIFIANQNRETNKVTPSKPKSKLTEIANKVLNIQSGIEAKIYSELYVGKNAKLGNEDATKFIEMITNNGLSGLDITQPTKYDENLDKMYHDIGYKYIDNDKSQNKKMVQEEAESSCCSVFTMRCLRYDNPFLNMNIQNSELMLQIFQINYIDMLNTTNQIAKNRNFCDCGEIEDK